MLCLVLAVASLQQGEARPARALLQTSLAFSEADAASWVTANLTGSSPDVQAASSAVAQAASMATSSGSASSSALASAFVSVLLSADTVTGNATAEAYAQALTNTIGDSNSQQVIAQAYSSAILSLYQANQVEVHLPTWLSQVYFAQKCYWHRKMVYQLLMETKTALLPLQAASTAVAAALLVGQDASVVAANAAAFATSNATAIIVANVSSNETTRPGIDCLDYSKAYADAVTSVITANPVQTSAAASAVAAAFAQGCAVEQATGLALTEAIFNLGCDTVGPILLSESAVLWQAFTCVHAQVVSL